MLVRRRATRRPLWSRPRYLLCGVPWGFPASEDGEGVCICLQVFKAASGFSVSGGLKSTFAKNIVREPALDVNRGKRPLVKTALHPPTRPAITECQVVCQGRGGCGDERRLCLQAVDSLASTSAVSVRETFDLGFHTFLPLIHVGSGSGLGLEDGNLPPGRRVCMEGSTLSAPLSPRKEKADSVERRDRGTGFQARWLWVWLELSHTVVVGSWASHCLCEPPSSAVKEGRSLPPAL